MTTCSAPAPPAPSVLAREMAAALPQSRRHALTDGGGDGQTYREGMFASVLVALAGHTEGRDALVLAAQLADDDATIVVAHVMATSAAPLTGGTEAAARRRSHLRDAGEEVYATLGPDPRVRYLPLSGMPFADAVGRWRAASDPTRSSSARTCSPASPASRGCSPRRRARSSVAPYGHRFVRTFAPARITVACGPARARPTARSGSAVGARRARRRRRAAHRHRRRSRRRGDGWPTPRAWRRRPPRRASRAAAPARWWRRRAETSTCWSSPAPTTRSCARRPARCWWSRPPSASQPAVAAQARR